jgi:hypothetical protein
MATHLVIRKPDELFEQMLKLKGKYVFRGQRRGTKDTYQLIPGIGRARNQGTDPNNLPNRLPYSADAEKKALAEFKRRCVTLVHPSVTSDLDWLAIAQHHGMPTRMLDWTASFMVAAHFALKSAGIIDRAAVNPTVLVLPCLREATAAERADPLAAKEDFLYTPPAFDTRIVAQKSVFTVHANPSAPLSHPDLTEIEIDSKICMKLKQAVSAHAIDHSMLFPDIGGIAEHCGWKYKWREF